MNKKIFENFIILGVILLTMIVLTPISNAALTISTSKSIVEPGEQFSVTVSVAGNEAGHITISASNGTLNQTNIDLMSQSAVTVTCTAGNVGTVSLSASGKVANYDTETEGVQNASKSVTVKAPEPVTPPETEIEPEQPIEQESPVEQEKPDNKPPEQPVVTKSSNNYLKSLSCSAEGLTPAFNKNTLEYILSVGNDVEEITVDAVPEDSKASVIVTGNKEFIDGENTVKVTVKAENGNTKVYTIKVIKAKKEELLLNTLVIKGLDEDDNEIELNITPEFQPEVFEYEITTKELLKTLKIENLASLDEAIVEIEGHEKLQIGENIIKVKLTLLEGEEITEYTIKLNMDPEEIIEDLTNNVTAEKENFKINITSIIIPVSAGVVIIAIIVGAVIFIKRYNSKDNDVQEFTEKKDKKSGRHF